MTRQKLSAWDAPFAGISSNAKPISKWSRSPMTAETKRKEEERETEKERKKEESIL